MYTYLCIFESTIPSILVPFSFNMIFCFIIPFFSFFKCYFYEQSEPPLKPMDIRASVFPLVLARLITRAAVYELRAVIRAKRRSGEDGITGVSAMTHYRYHQRENRD